MYCVDMVLLGGIGKDFKVIDKLLVKRIVVQYRTNGHKVGRHVKYVYGTQLFQPRAAFNDMWLKF